MNTSRIALLVNAISTIGGFGAMQLVRLASGVVIARLLTPELLGIMVLVYIFRYSAEQLSDIGIGQSMVSNKDAEKPEFYNTAWSLQVIRGGLLTFVFLAASYPLGYLYDAPVFIAILPVVSIYFALAGLSSMSVYLITRRMKITKLNVFELWLEIVSAVARIGLAYISPTIWALVLGSFVLPIARVIGSHFLIVDIRHKFFISKDYALQIFRFGKWIFFSALLFFLSSNFDRLYLGKVLPFAILGIFGIARNLSGMVGDGVARLCRIVIFPLIAAGSTLPREALRAQLAPVRLVLMMLIAVAVSLFVAIADVLITSLYDERYQSAGWMLPVLLVGLWFSVLATVNEWTLIGAGNAKYSGLSNGIKFIWILVALPLATIHFGVLGAVVAIATSDVFRYFPILKGQMRFRLAFAGQDCISTLTFFGLIVFWQWVRFAMGYGTSFDRLPM